MIEFLILSYVGMLLCQAQAEFSHLNCKKEIQRCTSTFEEPSLTTNEESCRLTRQFMDCLKHITIIRPVCQSVVEPIINRYAPYERNMCGCVDGVPACDVTCGAPISVQIQVKNVISPPTFHFSLTLTLNQQPLMRFLEAAVEVNPNFKFSATYSPRYNGTLCEVCSSGYHVDTVHGLRDSPKEHTRWQVVLQPSGTPLACGVSTYIPVNNETILFNFTNYL